MPHTQAAGVREASREETAGRVRAVVRRTMGIVMLRVVAQWAGAAEFGRPEKIADGDGVARRTALRLSLPKTRFERSGDAGVPTENSVRLEIACKVPNRVIILAHAWDGRTAVELAGVAREIATPARS